MSIKDLFLLDPSVVFLNHGSFGACPREVLAVQHDLQREMERNPVDFLGRRSAALLSSARSTLASHLGARADDLIFVPNATHAVNMVARSVALEPGDEVLGTDLEYGACDLAWEGVCQEAGARYLRVGIPLPFEARGFEERMWAGVTARTRVLFLSHITAATALILPLQGLVRRARDAGILVFVDGAHVPGQIHLDLDRLGADFYAGNCHKWLCAPKGSAFLHARSEHHAMLRPLIVSWGYSADIAAHAPYAGTSVLERHHQWLGTRDISAFLAIPAAIAFQARHDWEPVRRDCHALAARTVARICAMTGLSPICDDSDYAQMVAIPVPSMDAARLKRILYERHRIEVPVTSHEDRIFVRISVQGYNTPSDLDALVEALGEILPRMQGGPSPLHMDEAHQISGTPDASTSSVAGTPKRRYSQNPSE